MRLETAHRILIATFVVFAAFLGVLELSSFARGGGAARGALGAASLLVGLGFALYLKRFGREP